MADSVPKRRKGGIAQRIAAAQAEHEPELQSVLVVFLLEQFAWGHFSGQMCQQIAELALQDVNKAKETQGRFKDLEKISELGSHGAQTQNVHRDMMKFASAKSKLPEPLEIKLPFKGMVDQLQHIILPHKLFAEIFNSYSGAWAHSILPSRERLAEFWSSAEHHPSMNGHAAKTKPDWKLWTIPLGWHGDEVPVTGRGKIWCKMMVTFEWFSLLAIASTKDTMMWCWAAFDSLCKAGDNGTINQFFKVIVWSFSWLLKGLYPDRDHLGNIYPAGSSDALKANTQLAGGFCAILFGLIGDLDYYTKVLQLPRSTSHNPCSLCKCTLAGPTSWKVNVPAAPWKGLSWTPQAWKEWDGRSKSELFKLEYLTAVSVCLDWMHCKYLGQDMFLFGSVLWLLCFHVMPHTPKSNLLRCWLHIKAFYKANKTKHAYASLSKLTMFCRKSGGHKLRGKAAEVKSIGPALLSLWKQHMNAGLVVHKQIELLLKCTIGLDKIIDENRHEVSMSESDSKRLISKAFSMAQVNLQVYNHFKDEGYSKLFHVSAKMHMMLHNALLSGFVSPSLVWCFAGEDMMRKVQTLAQSCVKGVTGPVALRKMVAHYRLAMHLQFQKQQQES